MYARYLAAIAVASLVVGCTDAGQPTDPGAPTLSTHGATVVNGWYEGDEIYYIAGGIEEGVTERGENQIYLIGGDRVWQAQVVLHIPGEPGYTPHWNANLVNTAAGVTVADIVASPYVSEHYPEALFDDVEDILDAEADDLVTVTRLGVVVLCPIVPEATADAPGTEEGSEDFPRPWPETLPPS